MKKLSKISTALLLSVAFSGSATAQGSHSHAVYQPQENVVKQQRTQVDGYYRMMLGDYEVTALYDGYLSIGAPVYQEFTKLSKQELDDLISGQFRPMLSDGGVQTAVTGYLINTGKNLVLLDAGSGDVFDDKVGKLTQSLMKSGYRPEQVDIIIPTHLHFDHFSGVTRNGKMEFPNATVYIANQEKAFWLDTPIDKMPEHTQKYAQWTRDAVAPYARAGRVKYYDLGDEIIPNFKSVATTGHTPGHSSVEVSSRGETLFVWGDLLHNHALQLPEPDVAAEFDVDAQGARKARLAMLPELAKRKVWIAGAHLPFPGLGHLRQEKKGFSWIPVEYTPLEY
ncbi:MBL fold metallo-hydrolase [Actinobacillus succinogenes]|uniref:Beta-lactamase domain protein n=1 Tax=Actinobacillus succinogenes (strain ATCC 55618 / DSM 22257 / CCUG 43843 / 130Z) TaxID=339671 RepID=A6VPK0_ACTSZ|nr:MBL fold metallo-hydrolase [Actinobacillus succinogenes]ABR74897.1 beta-lactamase domain protein [Actinobacillus succinogenes 130Z]PHI40692.1 MBL fold metallo-hydrolase [Actinobacillus succinogenes]